MCSDGRRGWDRNRDVRRGGGARRVAQRGGEGVAVGVPLVRLLGHRPADDRSQVGRDLRRQVRHRVVEMGQGGRDRGVGVEGPVPGQALERHHAERVDVGCGRRGGAAGLLGREVLRRAHHLAGGGQAEAVGGAGDAEVGDLHLPVGRDQQVGRLHVAVHDAGPVRGADRVGRLGHQVADHLGVERLAAAQQRRERLPVDELHHEERARQAGAVRSAEQRGLPDVVDRRDARVVQRRGVPGLGLEPGAEQRVVGVLALEHLDRHGPAQRGVGGPPDLAHATGRDPRLQPVPVLVVDELLVAVVGHLITASITALAIGPP